MAMRFKEDDQSNKYFDDYDYFDAEDRQRLARMLMLSRAESGMSQEKVALELGIAKKTVQNWERGVSAPTLPQAMEWFRVMNVAAMPYFLQFIFPEMEGISKKDSDEKLRGELINLIETMPPEGIRQLMFLFYGDHGSSPRGVMNMVTAHLQTPMRDRYNHASAIMNDYLIAKDRNQIMRDDHVQPNVDILEDAIENGRRAAVKGQNSYTMM